MKRFPPVLRESVRDAPAHLLRNWKYNDRYSQKFDSGLGELFGLGHVENFCMSPVAGLRVRLVYDSKRFYVSNADDR